MDVELVSCGWGGLVSCGWGGLVIGECGVSELWVGWVSGWCVLVV